MSIVKNGGNSGDELQDGTFQSFQRKSTVAVSSSNSTSFTTRYAFVVGVDNGATAGDRTETLNTDYTVSFTVTAPGAYRLNVNTVRRGALTRNSDGGGNASLDIGGVSGSFTGGSLTSGGLGLGDPGSVGNDGSSTNLPFDQSASAVITGVSNGSPVTHTLRFTWSQNCRSDTTGFLGANGGDECAVRGGIAIQYGGESAGDYPGVGGRNQANDGHFVSVTLVNLCGNGTIDGSVGEACDQGGANGTSGSCCTSSCQFRSAGQTCRAAGDVCDQAETCTGSSATCPADGVKVGGTQCRGAAGVCDVAESCDGVSKACPVDLKSTALCRGAAGVCDVDDFCDGVGNNCPADAKSTAECRASQGVCDVAESCDGVGNDCPADLKSTAECRAVADVCDVAESCDGVGNDCPADGFEPASQVCRGAAGICDVAEFCTGSGAACPADARVDAGTLCRSESGVCDVEEFCDGVNVECPNDMGKPDGDGDGLCDIADNCPEDADPTFADDDTDGVGNVCDACTNIVPVEIVKPLISLKKINTPESDDSLKLTGVITVPTSPAIDPVAKGVRFRFEDPDGNEVLDVTIPGGAYNAALRVGWKVKGGGTAWSYSNGGKIVPLISGINAISIKENKNKPGELKFSIKGKTGFYPVFPEEVPLKVSVVIDAPFAQTGQCGESILNENRCIFDKTFSKLTCK
ncbi:MAG: hypothetical protein AB1689_08105 [Thermodesulfobacteriota bacterium]